MIDDELEDHSVSYHSKIITCQCCKKSLPRTRFISKSFAGPDSEGTEVCKSICNKCIGYHKQPTHNIKWNKPGGNAEDIQRPSIIDLMESYRERD